jgi:hypothetical protein
MTGEKTHNVPVGEKVVGTRLNPEYFDFMLSLLNDKNICRMEGKAFQEHTIDMQRKWFETNAKLKDRDIRVFLEKERLIPVGYFSFKIVSTTPKV